MGFSGIGITELLVILAIVAVLFGTRKLRNVGEDLGKAIKSFKSAMNDNEAGRHERSIASVKRIEPREAGADATLQNTTDFSVKR